MNSFASFARLAIFGIAAFLATGCRGNTPKKVTAADHFNEGYKAMGRGEYQPAIAAFTEAIRMNPQEPEFFLQRALAYRLMGDRENALGDYRTAELLDPQRSGSSVFAYRGEVSLEDKDFDQAIAHFDEALAINRFPRAYARAFTLVNRGIAHDEKGNHDKAIADFTEAIRIQPTMHKAYDDRGIAFIHKKDYARAIADFSDFIRLRPSDPHGYENRAQAYRAAGEEAKAVEDERKAKEVRNGN
jgi:tetratricopeptide (TPR) repeat protein